MLFTELPGFHKNMIEIAQMKVCERSDKIKDGRSSDVLGILQSFKVITMKDKYVSSDTYKTLYSNV